MFVFELRNNSFKVYNNQVVLSSLIFISKLYLFWNRLQKLKEGYHKICRSPMFHDMFKHPASHQVEYSKYLSRFPGRVIISGTHMLSITTSTSISISSWTSIPPFLMISFSWEFFRIEIIYLIVPFQWTSLFTVPLIASCVEGTVSCGFAFK